MGKEMEAFYCILNNDYDTDERYKLAVSNVEDGLNHLESIENANPSEALECLEELVDKERTNTGSCCHWRECLSKNKCILHNNDLMCSDYTRANTIKKALIKAQEMKESLEAEIKTIKTEKENLELKLRKQEKLLRIILNNIELDKNYSEQGSGSTKAYKLTIPNCISMEEDENYTDDCYPNSDFEIIDNFVKEESI